MPREAPRQFPLNLPHAVRLGAEDYFVGAANAHAYELVMSWPNWPDRILLMTGAEGSGRSHLASVWRTASGAHEAADAADAIRIALEMTSPTILLDDADRAGVDETQLFHLLNAARERHAYLLLAMRSTPTASWPMLPDLGSRLRALPVARLDQPDEAMVRAVLIKLLDDRQLRVDEGVVGFIAKRCDRSLASVRGVVDALDRESLARGKAVSRALAADVLAQLVEDDD